MRDDTITSQLRKLRLSGSLGESLAHHHTYRKRGRGNGAGVKDSNHYLSMSRAIRKISDFLDKTKYRSSKIKNERQFFCV